jgi:hypothetical protein
VAPVRASTRRARGDDYPEVPWDNDSLLRFAEAWSGARRRSATRDRTPPSEFADPSSWAEQALG